MIGRRGFITGLVSFVAAPAIVRVGSIMPVKVIELEYGIGPIVWAFEEIREWQFDHEAMMREFIKITATPYHMLVDR